jgi:hypothetical protein
MSNYEHTTSDLGFAAALEAAGIKLVRIDRSNSRRAVFVFDDSEQLRTYEREYWANELFVSAMMLNETLKRMKARLYS